MEAVQVINGNDFAVTGRYGGKDYLFAPGEPVEVDLEAVKHMFAWSQPPHLKAGALNRLGLLHPGGTMKTALEALDRFQFLQGRTVFEEPIGENPGVLRNPGGEPEARASGQLPKAKPRKA
jgi:hypothetical protein